MSKTIESEKFSLSLPTPVCKALKKEAEFKNRELLDYLRSLLIDHAIDAGFLDQIDAQMLKLYRSITDRAALVAKRLFDEGGPDSDITLKTFGVCVADTEWINDYRTFVGGNEHSTNNSAKASLNQNIGYAIKRAVGAEVDCDKNGNRKVVKVTGEIVKSYSKLKW